MSREPPIRLGAAWNKGKTVMDDVDKRGKEYTAEQDKLKKTTEDVQKIIAGKDERLNWIRLNEFIAKCLPQPDGTNLDMDVEFQKKHVRKSEAKAATEQYDNRKFGKNEVADVPLNDESLKHLASLDIEAVFAMYTDDLKDFMTKAKDVTKNKFGNELEGIDRYKLPDGKKYMDTMPEGGGWIVELRGYTYNLEGREFIVDTLVYNINKNGYAAVPAATADKGFPDPSKGASATHFFTTFCRSPIRSQACSKKSTRHRFANSLLVEPPVVGQAALPPEWAALG